jgi:DNA mismatch repair protein MutS2
MLERISPRSLVLLDELGSGTDPVEGEALGRALLLHLVARGCTVVATTHLSGLKELGFELAAVENASLEFDPQTLRPLFRLTLGLPGESNALLIARRHGLPAEVVKAAEDFLHRDDQKEERKVREQVAQSRRKALEHLEQAEKTSREVAEQRQVLDEQGRHLRTWAEGLEGQKEQEIDRVLRRVREQGLQLLSSLGTVPGTLAAKVDQLRSFLDGLQSHSSLGERRLAYILSRKKHDSVYLPRYRESCRVRRVDRAKGVVTVLYRSMSLEVPFSEVACPDEFVWQSSSAGREGRNLE